MPCPKFPNGACIGSYASGHASGHADVRRVILRDYVEQLLVQCIYFNSKLNRANGLTKITVGEEFKNFLTHLNLIETGVSGGAQS